MLKAKKIRLDVSAQDAATLEFMQGKCRGLYNWLVMRLRDGERWHFAQEKARLVECRAYDPALNAVYGKLLAEVYFRLDKAMQAFFRRVKNGETPGFPRVRPRHQFFTRCYPAAYLRFEGNQLILPTGGQEQRKRLPNVLATSPRCRPAASARWPLAGMPAGTITPPSCMKPLKPSRRQGMWWPLTWASRRWQWESTSRDASITSAARRAIRGTTSSWIRFAPSGIAVKRSHAGISTSRRSTGGSQNRSATSAVTVCIKQVISSLTNWLKGLW